MPTTATTTARGLLMPSPLLMLMLDTTTADTATATPMLTVIIINLLDIVKELRT